MTLPAENEHAEDFSWELRARALEKVLRDLLKETSVVTAGGGDSVLFCSGCWRKRKFPNRRACVDARALLRTIEMPPENPLPDPESMNLMEMIRVVLIDRTPKTLDWIAQRMVSAGYEFKNVDPTRSTQAVLRMLAKKGEAEERETTEWKLTEPKVES